MGQNINKELIHKYMGKNIEDNIFFSENTNYKYLIISRDSHLDLQFFTQGENIKGDIFAVFFGNKPLSANIVSHIQNSNSYINIFILSFIQSDKLIDVQGSIRLGKNITNSQGHLLEKNIILTPKGQKVKIKAVPRLDVYSNNVQATHGVSIDRLSEENLFYLVSKGLNEELSQELIIKGYIQNILEQFTNLPDSEKLNIENIILSDITKGYHD